MQKYIGAVVVEAEPEVRYEQTDVNSDTLVRVEGYHVMFDDGHDIWSPYDMFERKFRMFAGMTFGQAIEATKAGKKISRSGWNGKGMYVVYRTGYPNGILCNKNTADALGVKEGTNVVIRPYLQMRCADGTFQMWLASQSDILADDWFVVDDGGYVS